MARDVRIAQSFRATPLVIRSALTDEAFLTRRAELSGGQQVEVHVTTDAGGRTTTIVKRRLPAEVPAYARGLVSGAIELTEEQVWEPVGEAGCAATFEARFSAPMSATGQIELRPDAEHGTRLSNDITLRAGIPLIGGKLEALVAEQTERYLAFTKELLDEWLENPS